MKFTRRKAIKVLAGSLPLLASKRSALSVEQPPAPKIAADSFQPTRESLSAYEIPTWFRDAKLGIWAHWGPQSAAEFGDWYARNMYIEGCRQYRHHVTTYGHPSKFGYKDLIPLWKAEAFDAKELVGRYKAAGAKYFVSMGVHLDNFDLWNSRHTRWNAIKLGPKRDIVGEFAQAAREHGLKFGVSEHLWNSYKWFSVSHGSDREGLFANIPYDGADQLNADLYGMCPSVYRELPWNEDDIPDSWQRHWFARISDLLDQHQPDLVYCDGQIPFGDHGLQLVANYYNASAARNGSRVEVVYTAKRHEDAAAGLCVLDVERDLFDSVSPRPWQACTCVGNWHYDRNAEYKSPKRVVDLLVDVVSRNGNLLLNFPLRSNGTLDQHEHAILDDLTQWMAVNGEAIHGTRPWHTYGEGPTLNRRDPSQKYGETTRVDLTARDLRFTRKGESLYAFFMGWPDDRRVTIPTLAAGRPHVEGRIRRVELLGHGGELKWIHDNSGLRIDLPNEPTGRHAYVLKIEGLEV